jgi:chorismate dehydratase
LTLGSVPYLNARPLLWGLESETRLAEPSLLAEWLRTGEVDAALVPVVEALKNPRYWLVDGVGICCNGPVYSVILVLNAPLEEVRTVALDAASRTSVELTRYILETVHGLQPEYVADGAPADAQLRIGDPAIAFRREHPDHPVADLGEAWKRSTGLPFVFAAWAMRSPDSDLAERLRGAGRAGLAYRHKLTQEPWELRYLTESIRYELGDREKEGLGYFGRQIGGQWPLRWL